MQNKMTKRCQRSENLLAIKLAGGYSFIATVFIKLLLELVVLLVNTVLIFYYIRNNAASKHFLYK